jgi:hypothetical protein
VSGEGPLSFGECHGPIELPSGELVVHMARTLAGRSYEWDAWLLRSHDGGDTWGDCTRVPTHTDSDEISYEYLPESGRLLGVTRSSAAQLQRRPEFVPLVPGGEGAPLGSEAGDAAYQFHSDDGGRTFTDPVPTGLGVLQAAGAYPLRLRDGRVLLLYGHRQFPYGTQAVCSVDGGVSFVLDQPILLSWHSWSGYCGHPRSVQLQDGSIVTGYYTHRIHNPGDGPVDPGQGAATPNHNGDASPRADGKDSSSGDTGEIVRWWVPDGWPSV